MSWFKLFVHDLRCGLLRWRYICVLPLLILPCIMGRAEMSNYGCGGTWMDFMLYCFKGSKSIALSDSGLELELPTLWLLAVGGCLFLNLDYLLNDLTLSGQQIIVRSGTRRGWYLSKCLWNLCACVLYFALACLAVLLFTWVSGGTLALENTPALAPGIFRDVVTEPLSLTTEQGLMIGVLSPLVTIAALSMLEMTLCLLVKPVISFLICMLLLVLTMFWSSPFSLGIGAMAIRSGYVTESGIDAGQSCLFALAVIVLCILIGCWRFKRTDILGLEE